MSWVAALALFISPMVCVALYQRTIVARIGLSLVWILSGLGGAWFLHQTREVERDLQTLHEYPLPLGKGDHQIDLVRLSQGSMEGVLRGAGRKPSRADLEKVHWRLPEDVPTAWYDFNAREDQGSEDIPLFQTHWAIPQHYRSIPLQYRIGDEEPDFLRSRKLLVTHDASARHMLRDHLLPFLYLIGWALLGWSVLWLIIQGVRERRRRRVARSI